MLVGALLAVLVGLGVLVVSRGDAMPSVPAPTGLATSEVTYDSFDTTWAATPGATGYEVRITAQPSLKYVLWSGRTSGTGLHVAGDAITEGRTFYVHVTPIAQGVAGITAQPVAVRTPLQKAGVATRVRTTADTRGIGVGWSEAPRATAYQVVVASDKAMKHVVKRSARLPSPGYRTAVRDGATYYVTVRAFRGDVLGGTTAAARVRTPLKSLGVPGAPAVRAVSASSIHVAWKPAKNATGYTVTLASSTTAKARVSVHSSKTSLTIGSLHPAAVRLRSIFYVRVTADRWGKEDRRSVARPAALAAQRPATPVAFTASVATYNVMHTASEDHEDRSWTTRFKLSGRELRGVGIAGLQEAAWAPVGRKHPVDVVARAAHLAVAMHPHSSSPCTTESEPVLYSARRFTLLRCGYAQLSPSTRRAGVARYATWVELKNKASHQKVLVVNSHLVPFMPDHSGRSPVVQKARVTQATKLLALAKQHRRAHEPVILTGDYNSFPGEWKTTPLDTLAKAGYSSADLTARTTKDGDYASFHGFRGARDDDDPIDHVLTSDLTVAKSYQVHVTTSRKAPSDHYEVRAVLQVHRAR